VATGPILGSAPGGRLLRISSRRFVDLLAGEIDIGLLAEHCGHLREAVARQRASVFEARRAGESGLDAEGDLLFDFDGRERVRDGVDLHLVIGDVRHGVDRNARKRPRAERA
jgi:hypothetical protein